MMLFSEELVGKFEYAHLMSSLKVEIPTTSLYTTEKEKIHGLSG